MISEILSNCGLALWQLAQFRTSFSQWRLVLWIEYILISIKSARDLYCGSKYCRKLGLSLCNLSIIFGINMQFGFSDSSDMSWTFTWTDDLAIHRKEDVHLDLVSALDSVELVKNVHGHWSWYVCNNHAEALQTQVTHWCWSSYTIKVCGSLPFLHTITLLTLGLLSALKYLNTQLLIIKELTSPERESIFSRTVTTSHSCPSLFHKWHPHPADKTLHWLHIQKQCQYEGVAY